MFGQEAKLAALVNKDPPQVANEQALVAELRAKLGPGADPDKLLFQIRSARGKTHWAVNSYLRDVMTSSVPGQEDFQPSRSARAAAAAAAAAAAPSTQLLELAAESAGGSGSTRFCPAASPGPASRPSSPDGGAEPALPPATASESNRDLRPPLPGTPSAIKGPKPPTQRPPQCPSPPATEPAAAATTASTATAAAAAVVVADVGAPGSGGGGEDSGGAKGSGGNSCSGCSGGGSPGLDSLPVSLLEAVCRYLDYRSLCAAAMTSRALCLAATSDSLWSALYDNRWGTLAFPTEPHLVGSGSGPALGTAVEPGPGSRLELGMAAAADPAPRGQGAAATAVAGAEGESAGGGSAPLAANPDAALKGRPPLLLPHCRTAVPRCQQRQQRQRLLRTMTVDQSVVEVPELDLRAPDLDAPSRPRSAGWPGGGGGSSSSSSSPGSNSGYPPCPSGLRPAGSPRQLSLRVKDPTPGRAPAAARDGAESEPGRGPAQPLPPPPAAQQQQQQQPLGSQRTPLRPSAPTDATAIAALGWDGGVLPAYRGPSAVPAPSRAAIAADGLFAAGDVPAATVYGGPSLPLRPSATAAATAAAAADGSPAAVGLYVEASQPRVSGGRVGDPDAAATPSAFAGNDQAGGCEAGAAPAAATPSPTPPTLTPVVQGGSAFRLQYRRQMSYLMALRCPRCGSGSIVPIVYGFPSPKLMEGMRRGRLILGGDHLIENCHVWGCNRCGASFRHFPYDRCDTWVSELVPPQPQRPGHLPHYTYEL